MRCFVLLASFLAVPDLVAASDRHCLGPGDITADHVVDLSDHFFLADCMGGPGSELGLSCLSEHGDSADFDVDGDIDLQDFAKSAIAMGNEYFDYGSYREDKEAERYAIRLTNELRAPDFEYDRIHRDLGLIHEAFPDTQDVQDVGTAADNGLVVGLHSNDNRDDFDKLNSYYVAFITRSFQTFPAHEVTFCDNINPSRLSSNYNELDEVEWATPNQLGCIPGCCLPWIQIDHYQDVFTYDFSFYYVSPKRPDEYCVCWRNRVLETNNAGNLEQVTCEDSCLPECP